MAWLVTNWPVIVGGLGVLLVVLRFIAPFTATKIDDWIVDALDLVLKLTRGKAKEVVPTVFEDTVPPVEGSVQASLKSTGDQRVARKLEGEDF